MFSRRRYFAVTFGGYLMVRIWQEHGTAAGLAALGAEIMLTTLFLLSSPRHPGEAPWMELHPVVDTAVTIPVTFLFMGYFSKFSLPVCLAAGVVLWLLLLRRHYWRRAHPQM
jgi:Na+/H+ antiporter NhaC